MAKHRKAVKLAAVIGGLADGAHARKGETAALAAQARRQPAETSPPD